ncbi:histidinol-phosphatase HisJ [Chengkuizengella sediminis]|uniref:histidinol-phosphatase HisJ n=1 Tax=Chengkuizengella sediminis TaxID=1885917 RepID=UPI001389430A|nr:histidinol-phosphatase HisJ [Chengkuizengella sediminis]NDI36572.1 histidinol-phosphatase HisJ [Chengkuizengella sediminis]
MLIDYHTHHERCGHASGSLEDYVKKGIEIGLQQLGLSDHMPLIHVDPKTYLPGMAMPADEIPRYVEECFLLKKKYKNQIDIKVGLEADYIEGYETEIEKIISSYPWDYVIGSVHFLGEWDISDFRQLDHWENRDVDEVFAQYYDAVQKAVKTDLYDYIGHLDVIKRFGRKPKSDMIEIERQTLNLIKEHGLAIELNASGLRMPVEEMFPSERILLECHKLDIPLTIGSDAHKPEQLGLFLDQARNLLKKIGFTQLATYDQRKRIMVCL